MYIVLVSVRTPVVLGGLAGGNSDKAEFIVICKLVVIISLLSRSAAIMNKTYQTKQFHTHEHILHTEQMVVGILGHGEWNLHSLGVTQQVEQQCNR